MAGVSATSVRFGSSLRPSIPTTQTINRPSSIVKLVSLGSSTSFPSLRSSRLQVCCAAKPETVEKVMSIVKKQLALSDDIPVTPQSKFAALGADSLDTVEIVMSLEEEFNITVEEDNSQNILTVQDAADVIEKLIEQKGAAA